MKLIFPNERGMKSAFRSVAKKKPKAGKALSLSRVYDALPEDIELHTQLVDMDSGTVTLEIDAVDPHYADRLGLRLQKKAFPKSEWHYDGSQTWLRDRMVTHIIFQRRNHGTKTK